MILGATIEQLRTYCAPFSGRVAGAADFNHGLVNYNENMDLPAAYVVPLDQEVESGNKNEVGLWQIIRKTVGVIVELDARVDRRGQKPAMEYDEIEAALFSSLLNWAPVACRVPGDDGYEFLSGRMLDLDRARVFYQWEFLLEYLITDDDAWQQPEGEDLMGIEVDLYSKEGAVPVEPEDIPAAIIVIPTSNQPPVEPAPLEEELEGQK